MCLFQNGSSTSRILNKSTVSQSLHVIIYVEKARVIEGELFHDISPVLSLETLCLVGCG